MDYSSVNGTSSGLLQNEIDYNKVVGVYPVTYDDSIPYTAYPPAKPQENIDINNYNNYNIDTNINVDYDTSNTVTYDNDILAVTANNNIVNNNVIESTGYQTSFQTSELIDANNVILSASDYSLKTPNVEYTTSSIPAEYSTNTYDVTNDYTNNTGLITNEVYTAETNNNLISQLRDSFNNLGTGNIPYSTGSYNRRSSYTNSVPSNYDMNSLPANITPEMMKNAETEIIPVEEIEYIPIKTKKFIKRIKIRSPVKKVVVPKKVIIPVPVKKTVYVQKKPNLINYAPIAYPLVKQIPLEKHMVRSSSVPNYQPKVYRRKI